MRAEAKPKIGLFVTCLVDLFRPSIGYAAARLIESTGCSVEAPMAQGCCGRPALSSGDRAEARAAAEAAITAFEDYDHVVAPSGACAGMLRKHYPALFDGDAAWERRAGDFASKVHELAAFLVEMGGIRSYAAGRGRTATYHDACSGLRDLGVMAQPRALLSSIEGLTLIEMPEADACCGFGDGLCAKYPSASRSIASRKAANIEASGADMLLGGELGCLMAMAGKLKRAGSAMEVRHVAEVLAGMEDDPPIGGPRSPSPSLRQTT
ncbi:(Fe-S)-binding protein [Mesorhizobium sp. 1B3]|uniref:(Fe-S)-binding protein n=1 Tax=Mesorhizobium sp. 1B3 TaxID=3243599 RepID=UPI003D9527BD